MEAGTAKKPPIGLIGALAGLTLIAVAIDFTAFCRRAALQSAPLAPQPLDAIVALTGGSGKRITAGVDLLAKGAGKRLLISGVNSGVSLEQLSGLSEAPETLWECCIDLGHEARSTVGNAGETAAWAGEQGFRALYVVTSDYHMPRSLIELGQAMPGVRLTPYPVRTRHDPAKVWRDPVAFRRLLAEWAKWRVTQVRRGRSQ